MAREIFAFISYDFANPSLNLWGIYIVTIDPLLIGGRAYSGIIRRINIDAFYPTFVTGEQRFQRFQIIRG